MNTITNLGAERLRYIADQIELHAERFNYGTWLDGAMDGTIEGSLENLVHGCGTTGCVAGWAAAIAHQEGLVGRITGYDVLYREAEKYLGLGARGSMSLFFSGSLYAWRQHHDPDWRPPGSDDSLSFAELEEHPEHWGNAEAVEVAKMLRAIVDGEHPDWEVVG